MRRFETGATRDAEDNKLDYEGFFSPLVLKRRAEYMHKHRVQSDGSVRDSDNWQKGMPFEAYMKSAWRHFRDWWEDHRKFFATDTRTPERYETLEDEICALMFNCEGYLHELLKERNE